MTKKGLLVLTLSILAIAMVSALLLAGCGSSSDDTTTTVAPATTTTAGSTATTTAGSTDTTVAATTTFDGELAIGALNSQTGDNAMTGAEQKWAQQKAVDDVNAKGGVVVDGKHLKLVLKFVDDQSDSNQGAAAMEKLIKVEGIKLILSSNITPINLAAATVADKYQAYFQISTSWTDAVAAQKFKWASDVFFTPAAAAEVPFGMVEEKPAAERPTKWAELMEDNTDGQGLGAGVKAIAAEHGITIADYESYTPGTKDFSSVILKFKQQQIDGLVILISPADGITLLKQMKEQDYSPKFIFGWKGFWPTEFMSALGPDSDYVGHDGFWSADNGQPGSKELGDAFTADHNGLDSVSIGLPYASVQVLAQAITNANSSDPAAVRDAVWGHTFSGTTMGDITYDAAGIANVQPYGLMWMNQKRVLIYPDQGNQWDWFVPWGQR